ncbi:GP46-like surface antigen, putative [Bodo saltans]|uniref:GP46-like surface antigen, putative n=1 Tax=Bodo saltans TaxID=75058 RepID=A0A0S4IJ71_BODSA|nr:GP46-like surface antigen, putative [Bodo saltans]|eukprot:CUE76055.1 GP46-like surface antigen, putative [Bodo saltans]
MVLFSTLCSFFLRCVGDIGKSVMRVIRHLAILLTSLIVAVHGYSMCGCEHAFPTLMEFHNATNGDGWLDRSGWGNMTNCSNWFGLTCTTSEEAVQPPPPLLLPLSQRHRSCRVISTRQRLHSQFSRRSHQTARRCPSQPHLLAVASATRYTQLVRFHPSSQLFCA